MDKTTLKPVITLQDNGMFRISTPKIKNTRIKINNPINHKSFALRQRNTKNGKKGQIKGKYKRLK